MSIFRLSSHLKGNRTLCIVNGPEKYDTLKTSLGNVISDINCIIKNSKIEVDGKEVKIEMFLGGGGLQIFDYDSGPQRGNL